MNKVEVRNVLKRNLPLWAIDIARGIKNYPRRLASCISIAQNVQGRTASDRAILRRSLARAPIDMFGDFSEWREPVLMEDAEVLSRGLGTFKIRRCTDDLAHVNPVNYKDLFTIIRAHVHPGDTVVDAGANIGAVTTFLSKTVGAQGRVIAIEMMPDTANILRNNIALNSLSNVTVIEKALAEHASEVAAATVVPGLHGQASIAQPHRHGLHVSTTLIQTTTLDSELAKVKEIAFLKLDIEGAEAKALLGAKEVLGRTRVIFFESWKPDGGEAGAILQASGYQIKRVDGLNLLACREG